MDSFVHSIMGFVSQHAGWALPVVFVVSFGESFVLISLAFPGTSMLLAAGALISAGACRCGRFWPGPSSAPCLGDSISYWLGLRYGHLTETRWPFTRHPEILPRGYAFFDRHGVKSVFIGRFFGPHARGGPACRRHHPHAYRQVLDRQCPVGVDLGAGACWCPVRWPNSRLAGPRSARSGRPPSRSGRCSSSPGCSGARDGWAISPAPNRLPL